MRFSTIPCTNCKYCMKVCPKKIQIPGSFQAMNLLTLYEDYEEAKGKFDVFIINDAGSRLPVECVKCGACERVCPLHIKIRDNIEKIMDTFVERV